MKIEGMRVLVTGADGFIGSHLVEALVAHGCRVRAMVYYNAFNSWGWLDTLAAPTLGSLEVQAADIRDRGAVEAAVRGVDVVFHLAALIGIPYSYVAPESYVATNIGGTLNVLEAARRAECRRVLVTSTSEVYGTARYVPMDEQHPLQAQSPYSASKIGADRIAESYHRSFGLPVTIVRPFNTYGPRQSARAIVPTVITQLMAGSRRLNLGNLTPTRDMNFVADTVGGFLALAECDEAIGQEVNIASGSEVSMGRLVEMLIELTGSDAVVAKDEQRARPAASEVERLLGSNAKITRLTAWRPRVALAEGLRATVEWFRDESVMRRYKPGLYNV